MKYEVKFTNQFKKDLKLAKKLNIDKKEWVFTVHFVTACSFLFLPKIMKNKIE
jgi:mRNA-degrading endonuclease YafQ of YafQ-DinJ toxin-antitoxin module